MYGEQLRLYRNAHLAADDLCHVNIVILFRGEDVESLFDVTVVCAPVAR